MLPSRKFSLGVVVVMCGLSFLGGRLSTLYTAFPDPGVEEPSGEPAYRRGARETGGDQMGTGSSRGEVESVSADSTGRTQGEALASQRVEGDVTRPGPVEFEAAMQQIGLLDVKPPVGPGASGNSFYITQPMQVLSWYPRIVLWPNFLDKERCEHVIQLAQRRIQPSMVAFKKGDTAENTQGIRTSQGTFLGRHQDAAGVLAWVEERIAALTGVPVENGEAFNVLKYVDGQHYDGHYDRFFERDYGKRDSNRIATVLVYLNTVEQGGSTVFPLEGESGLSELRGINYKACKGLQYRPRQGDAVLFWSVHVTNGSADEHALHGGCPVEAGEKWVMTKWLQDHPVGFRG